MIPKFRAWDNVEKKFVEHFFITDNVLICNMEKPTSDYGIPIPFEKSELTLMQSTGLKDKNGQEIFEGDILEIQGIKMVVKFGSYRYLETSSGECQTLGVMYDGLGFYVECINAADPDRISPFEPETLKNSQIVGNIWEE
ncbi:YopX family protein [Streptococcus infantis]|uniref:YopX family protein n=1 Tax=Streptococcus infantis TaxID=68892 RepID=UPI001CBCF558|nr:YopX family protein [Streptococcus infantis]MBZ2109902.1 YopX family protein [Streptococcus infantis]MBZ2111750.1 YopX family protein [Streptococcus infantis]